MSDDQILFRPLKATEKLRSVMGQYYAELDEASSTKSRKIAWCTSQGPVELLRAMGFLVYFPENHGALLGATRRAMDFIGLANAEGYSPDVCSYLTSDIGAFLAGKTPLKEAYGVSSLPVPDVLVYNNNQCRDVQEWFEFYSRRYGVPVLGIRTPRGVEEAGSDIIDSVAGQMEELADDLARIAGGPLDLKTFSKTIERSKQTSILWKSVLETASHRPSPITFIDACFHIGPAVNLRGTDLAVSYYQELLEELEDRISKGTGAIFRERFRIYWEGMPIWGRLRFLADTMAKMQVSLVASTYGHSWVFDAFDPHDPFYSTAKAYTELFTVRNERSKESFLLEMLKRFQVDGIIFHNSKTCPNCTNSLYGMPKRLSDQAGIPYLVVDGDLNDLRCFSQEQTLTNLEAFVEMLAQ
ncbi:MAG: 2-hydroxyacyl-CoA dehydratase [Desulfobacteraceae bacterium]|jgi:benzoyl-CoA reductase/2-hydroxyglutaryl-CoA dehydratase subunit BcrC/BadD/HgdB|nr:2-hydroxyacyl-CoA dehydratase [Desulfobacteraceae bacterium]